MLKRLAELRKEKNWSMQETADHLGIAKSTYAGYESGYREPSLHALVQIADLFETTVDYLLNRINFNTSKLEITELLDSPEMILYLDQTPLSHEELYDFIAFNRTKRELKEKK